MKKLFITIAAVLLTATCSAQHIVSTKTLKTTDLGNQKLEVAIADGDTAYCITLATGNRFQSRITFGLGDAKESLRLLQWLYDLDAKSGDIIDLENATHNTAKWSGASGYTIYSEGGQLSGHLRKPNIRGFMSAIKKHAGM